MPNIFVRNNRSAGLCSSFVFLCIITIIIIIIIIFIITIIIIIIAIKSKFQQHIVKLGERGGRGAESGARDAVRWSWSAEVRLRCQMAGRGEGGVDGGLAPKKPFKRRTVKFCSGYILLKDGVVVRV